MANGISNIENMIRGLQPIGQEFTSTATANINRLTNKRVRDLLSRFATTGLNRSGISGAALSDVYSTAGQNLSDVAARGAELDFQSRQAIINQLLGLEQLKFQREQADFDIGDILGAVGGGFAGSVLGPVGAGAGRKISDLLFGNRND